MHTPNMRRGPAAVAVALLLSVLMVWNSGPAAALQAPIPSVPVAGVGGEVAGEAEFRVLTAVSRVCSTTCIGVSVGLLATGLAASATTDIWFPWLQNKLDHLGDVDPTAGPWLLDVDVSAMPTADSPVWLARFTARPGNPGQNLNVGADTICRQPSGLRYQVIKATSWESGIAYLNADSFYWNGQTGPTNAVTGYGTYYTTPPNALLGNTGDLDPNTPNPAHGRNNDGSATDADNHSLCNAGDTMEGSTITATQGNGARRVWTYGTRANPDTATYHVETGCVRPDGSTYVRSEDSRASDNPVAGPGFAVPTCSPGDRVSGVNVSQDGNVVASYGNAQAGYPNGTASAPVPGPLAVSGWTANSTYAGYVPSNVGDGNPGTFWNAVALGSASAPNWLRADLTNPSVPTSITVTPRGDCCTDQPPGGNGLWSVEGLIDGTWRTLYSASSTAWSVGVAQTFQLQSLGTATAVRIWGSVTNVAEVGIKGLPPAQPQTSPQDRPYPSCVSTSCAWSVWIDGQVCTAARVECQGWTQVALDAPSRVQCHYGPYVLALASCYWLERSYEDDSGWGGTTPSADGPNTDGNPATHTGPTPTWQPTPSPSVTPTLDPQPSPTSTATATLDPQPQPSPTSSTATATLPAPGDSPSASPSSSPGSSPSSSTSPVATATGNPSPTPTETVLTGTVLNPGEGCQVACVPEDNPSPPDGQTGECFPNGWSAFNPVEWVLKPIKCGFYWAFVPPAGAGFDAAFGGIKDSMHTSPFGDWWDQLNTFEGGFTPPGVNDCRGPGIDMSSLKVWTKAHQPATIYPFDACTDPKATVAKTAWLLQSGAIVFFGFWRCIRILGAPFGYNVDIMDNNAGGRYLHG